MIGLVKELKGRGSVKPYREQLEKCQTQQTGAERASRLRKVLLGGKKHTCSRCKEEDHLQSSRQIREAKALELEASALI